MTDLQHIYIGMGCFWGVERIYWQLPGVHATEVGYAGGTTPHPTYEQVCTGATGHAEVVKVSYDDDALLPEIFKAFWENHNPTQGNRQGNDIGTQYRSVIFYTTPAQLAVAEATKALMESELAQLAAQRGVAAPQITTSFEEAGQYYRAEEYHQRYLEKNPNGYCNHGPNGCSIDVTQLAEKSSLVREAVVLPGLIPGE